MSKILALALAVVLFGAIALAAEKPDRESKEKKEKAPAVVKDAAAKEQEAAGRQKTHNKAADRTGPSAGKTEKPAAQTDIEHKSRKEAPPSRKQKAAAADRVNKPQAPKPDGKKHLKPIAGMMIGWVAGTCHHALIVEQERLPGTARGAARSDPYSPFPPGSIDRNFPPPLIIRLQVSRNTTYSGVSGLSDIQPGDRVSVFFLKVRVTTPLNQTNYGDYREQGLKPVLENGHPLLQGNIYLAQSIDVYEDVPEQPPAPVKEIEPTADPRTEDFTGTIKGLYCRLRRDRSTEVRVELAEHPDKIFAATWENALLWKLAVREPFGSQGWYSGRNEAALGWQVKLTAKVNGELVDCRKIE
jgi:hypothetical protein